MRLFRRHNAPSAFEELLAALDAVSGRSHMAQVIRDDIRANRRHVTRWTAWAAFHASASAGAWVTFDPVVAALARYEKNVNGVDLALAPSMDQRRRMAADAALARVREMQLAQVAAAGTATERRLMANLETVRREQRGGA